MKKKLLLTLSVVIMTLSTLILAACAEKNPPPPPENLIQIAPDATTRGGFTVSRVENVGRGGIFGAYFGDIAAIGYVEEEFLIEGVAQRYAPVNALKDDGVWTLQATDTAPYKTRFVVRRPADPAKFNGTVALEWANVSGGYEISLMDSDGLYEEGFAYVAASVQMNGIYGFAENPQGLAAWDRERYGDLSIPDDGLSYDIYTQIARAVGKDRPTDGVDPMGGLAADKIFAVGESQSGSRVLSYANGVQPIENVFDAIVSVVSAGRGTDFSSETAHVKEDGKTTVRNVSTRVREDINCKAFVINTQTESVALGKLAQPDTANIVSWQIAGAAHFAPYAMDGIINQNIRDGIREASESGKTELRAVDWTYVYEAALVRIQEWIDFGKQPPEIQPLSLINVLLGYNKDKYGNAKGGVRLPEITAPIAKYDINIISGGLSGSVYAFKQKDLLKLYPTHQDYVEKVTREANAAAALGVVLPYRAEKYIEDAKADWVATLWTDAPAIELTGSPFDFIPLILVGVCAIPLAVIGVIAFLIVKKIKSRKKRAAIN